MPKKKKIEIEAPAPKPNKLFNNLLKITRQFMSGRSYLPMTQEELMERLRLPPQHSPILTDVLKSLVKEGVASCDHNKYAFCESKAEVITGVLHVHPRGFGFLQPDDPSVYSQDIFIPKHLTQNAVDGDIVEVVVNTEAISDKGPEGRVLSILSRGRTHMAGIIKAVERHGDVLAYVPLLGAQQRVVVQSDPSSPLKVGDRIVMEVIDWGSKETETLCRMSHHIGHISDPSCDINAAIEEYELRSDFPTPAVQEAKKLGSKVLQKEIKGREDLRDMECFTIDPDTAKDFDDALTLTKDRKGQYHLGVHIADVSHYVRPGTALDKEARQRCNSTYFPNYCLPMLPPELSENLCSLKPEVDRLTASVFMDFDKEGNLIGHRMARTVIHSAKRFTYKEAKNVLDGKLKSPHKKTLKLMVELCYLLKKKRYERGSIEFSLPELVILVNEKGIPQGTDYIAYDITHQLVEEFMLKANEMVAFHLTEQGKGLTYRIHEEPMEENIRDFATLANAFGFQLSDKPTNAELQKLFDEALHTPYGSYLATSYIRRMKLAAYSADNIGHYGLGLTHYCHFTSPIRRYVDLVVHRILFGEPSEREDLETVAHECSEQERISSKAEGNVVLLKKLRLLQTIHEKTPHRDYEAVITRVKNFGFFFEVLEFMLEGFVHVSELESDYFIFEETKLRLRGRHTGHTYTTGDRIRVMLKDVDFITLESHWYLGEVTERKPKKKETVRKKKARKVAKASKKQKQKPKAKRKKPKRK